VELPAGPEPTLEMAATQPHQKDQTVSPASMAEPGFQTPEAPIVMEKTYKGKKISVSINNASLRDFIVVISQMSGTKIELSPNVDERLTLNLEGVPWDQALELVANCYGLEIKERAGTMYLTRPGKGREGKTNSRP
jgi:type II secretory pathway component HofQ